MQYQDLGINAAETCRPRDVHGNRFRCGAGPDGTVEQARHRVQFADGEWAHMCPMHSPYDVVRPTEYDTYTARPVQHPDTGSTHHVTPGINTRYVGVEGTVYGEVNRWSRGERWSARAVFDGDSRYLGDFPSWEVASSAVISHYMLQ